MQILTPEQIKAARYLAPGKLTVERAAEGIGIAFSGLQLMENGEREPRLSTMRKIYDFYTSKGIEFGPDGWVRLRPQIEQRPTPRPIIPETVEA